MSRKTLFNSLLCILLLVPQLAVGEISKEWENVYTGDPKARDLQLDPAGDVYVLGTACVLKYDAAFGELLWSYALGDDEGIIGANKGCIAVGPGGEIYAAWKNYDATPSELNLTKLENNGTLACEIELPMEAGYEENPIGVDEAGNIYVGVQKRNVSTDARTGFLVKYNSDLELIAGPVDVGFSPEAMTIEPDSESVFVTSHGMTKRYDSDLSQVWETPSGGLKLKLSAGDLFAVGYMKVDEHLTEALIVKFDAASGEVRWERYFSRPIVNVWSYNYAFDVDTDSSGNAYVVGQSTLTNYGDCLVLKYSTSGELLWENPPLSTFGSESAYSVDVDDNGFAYVVGYTWDGSYHLLSFRCSPSGEVDWMKVEGADSFGTCVALSQDGKKIYAAGDGDLGRATPGVITIKYGSSVSIIDEYGSSVPIIDKPRPRSPYPGEILTITGQGFGNSQGNSQVHIGPRTIKRVVLWSDTRIRVRIPFGKKQCSWFKHGDGQCRRRRVWVTVGMEDSNIRRIRVMKPGAC